MYSLTRANEEPKIKVGYIHSNISYVLQHMITQHVVFPFYQCENISSNSHIGRYIWVVKVELPIQVSSMEFAKKGFKCIHIFKLD